jgi:putative ABC transport system substrate-binding protein
MHSLSSVVLLYNPNVTFVRRLLDDAQAASRSTNIMLSLVEVGTADKLPQAFGTITQNRPDAVLLGTDAMLFNERKRIAEWAVAHRLPTVGFAPNMAEAGLLMSYGPDFPDIFRRAAVYIDKILKGAKPADLPIEQPTKFDLSVNMRTAHAIGMTIPDSIHLRANKIVE